MLGLLRRRLADLGTAKKLAIGFTLVLLLTALVAALAVLSLHALGQRFARLQEMSAINRDVLEVRQGLCPARGKERRRALAPAPGRDP